VFGDGLDESDEQFTVNMSQPRNAMLTRNRAVATIVDDDAPPPRHCENATIVGTDDPDFLNGHLGDDTAYGGDGNDVLIESTFNRGDDVFFGVGGNDYAEGGSATIT